jgi:tetratricopeptide repeat protein 8
MLLDDNAMASAPRPGTSLSRPQDGGGGALNNNQPGGNQSMRPISSSGRPLSGFARPGSRSGGRTANSLQEALAGGGRPGTGAARPMTSLGRRVRLGTASMLSDHGGPFINADRLNVRKYARRPSLAKVLCDYLLYQDNNPKKAMELAAEATQATGYKDWWWKARLGKAYYQLGLFRDAEKQFKSSLRDQDMVVTSLELAKCYLRLDQPTAALACYKEAQERHPTDTSLLLGIARTYDMINDQDNAVAHYKQVLRSDPGCIEAIACMAAHHFYNDQPEVALRFYRRLVQMGLNNTELWNNLGLCCYYAAQYDMALGCFERALALADDGNMADVWYNIGQVAVCLGDLGLAYQTFKIAISIDSDHAEAYCNLGVLELRMRREEKARSNFQSAMRLAPYGYEAFYNGALLAYNRGNFERAHTLATTALANYPGHSDSKELLGQLRQHFTKL